MKNRAIIFATAIGLIFLYACKKDLTDPKLDLTQTVKPGITSPAGGTSYILTEENEAEILTTFEWSETTYGLTNLEDPSYTLQMSMEGMNFSPKKDLYSGTDNSFSINVGNMNSELVAMGLSPDTAYNVNFRLRSFLSSSTDISEVYSEVITLEFTPFTGEVTYAKLWVPGDYQGWNPAEAPNVFDFDGDGVYNGYIFFPEGGTFEFKFTSDPDWDHTNYGVGATPFDLDTDPGAGNLTVPGPGGYQLEVDINNLTWNYGEGVQNWGVIGEWLAWEEDIDMIYDPIEQYLHVTVENIPAADNQRFKYRANDAWDVNLGAKDPDDGTLVQGGADIPIPNGGTIKFILRFTTPQPTYEYIEMK